MENNRKRVIGDLNTEEPPYSIFDQQQKWVIIAIVSTAATCKCFRFSKVVLQAANVNM